MTPELLASCWTTAGPAAPMTVDERSPFPLEDRIAAAAHAGFVGFGLLHADLVDAEARRGLDWIGKQLNANGIIHLELEMLNDWFADGARRARSNQIRADLLRAAQALGARHIKIGGEIRGIPWDWSVLVDSFGQLCEEAARAGTKVVFEPMPFGQISNLVTGRQLIDDAGADNGGLILDLWHMERGRIVLDDIAALPSRYILAVELDDADDIIRGTLLNDTLHHRRLCGDGSLDVRGFINAVTSTGYTGPWGVEILSDEFRALSLYEQTTRAFTTTSPFLVNIDAPT
jgi:sugar phosphate isomerase/epimerase